MHGRKRLTLFDSTMLVMGGIIGIGIFFNPSTVARVAPEPGPYLAAWLLGGFAALAGAMTFAELSAAFPRSGGWYVFLREAFGRFPAFLFAWVVLFVVSTGALALVARFLGTQVAILAGADGGAWPPRIGAAALVGVTAIALTGVKSSALFQNTCMLAKLGAIAVLVAAGFAPGAPEPAAGAAAVEGAASAGSFGAQLLAASLPVLFSYGGWQLLSYIAPEVDDPNRNLPRAIVLGVLGVTVVYVLANLAYLRVLGIEGLAAERSFATTMAARTLGDFGGRFLTAAMAVSALGFLVATIIATPGLYVAMSKEGLFPRAFGRESARTGAPALALVVQCAIALAYLVPDSGSVDRLTGAVVFAEWIFHAMCGLALLRLAPRLGRHAGPSRPFISPLYPLFPVAYTVIAAAVVLGNLRVSEAEVTRLGLGVLALGALVYVPWTWIADVEDAA